MSVVRERAFPRQNSQSKLNIRDIEINTVSSKKSPFPAIFLFGAIHRAGAQRQKWRDGPSQRAGKNNKDYIDARNGIIKNAENAFRIRKGDLSMRRKNMAPDSSIVCSRVFAEWLLKQVNQNDSSGTIWLDPILKYCNSGYEELIAEELRKANQFYYTIREGSKNFTIHPSYKLVRLRAHDPADRSHILPVKGFRDGYSVLTTGAAFPGKQQFPFSFSERWDLRYFMDDCVLQGIKMMQIFEKEPDKIAYLHKSLSKRTDADELLVWEDLYKYFEFFIANEYHFVDNQFPFSLGPSCPDRMFSVNTYRNIIRRAAWDCVEICERMGLNKQYQEIFIVLLARTILLYGNKHCWDWRNRCRTIPDVIALADKTYDEYVEKIAVGKDLNDYCIKIRAFLNSRVKIVMESPNEENARGRADMRNIAEAHKDTALDDYISPQEMDFGNESDEVTDVII